MLSECLLLNHSVKSFVFFTSLDVDTETEHGFSVMKGDI